MPDFSPIPPALRVEDTCDYCRRCFVRARGLAAVCPSCGIENPRPDKGRPIESGMVDPPTQKAVLPKPRPRSSRKRS